MIGQWWILHMELPVRHSPESNAQNFLRIFPNFTAGVWSKQHPGVEFQILVYKRQRDIQTFVWVSW